MCVSISHFANQEALTFEFTIRFFAISLEKYLKFNEVDLFEAKANFNNRYKSYNLLYVSCESKIDQKHHHWVVKWAWKGRLCIKSASKGQIPEKWWVWPYLSRI